MSPQQSIAEKNEAQLKRSGRSAQNHQNSLRNQEPASVRSGKRSNGQGRGNPAVSGSSSNVPMRAPNEGHAPRPPMPGQGFEQNVPRPHNDANMQGRQQAIGSSGVSQPVPRPTAVPPKSNGILPRPPPIPQPNSVNTSEKSSLGTPAAAPGELNIQFGTFLPDSGFQVPQRTSSAPPNFNELKQEQARFANNRVVAKPPPVSTVTQKKPQDQVALRKDPSKPEIQAEEKKNMQTLRPATVGIHAPPVHMPSNVQQMQPVYTQIQSQPHQFSSQGMLPNTMQVPGLQNPLPQPQMYGLQNTLLQQAHGFSQPLHHIMSQVNSSTTHIPSSQIPLSSHAFQVNPQMGAPIYMQPQPQPQPLLNTLMSQPQRTSTVTIRRPDTREEVTPGRKNFKPDHQPDTAPTVSTNTTTNRISVVYPQSVKKDTVMPSGVPATGVNNKVPPVAVLTPNIQQHPVPSTVSDSSALNPSREISNAGKIIQKAVNDQPKSSSPKSNEVSTALVPAAVKENYKISATDLSDPNNVRTDPQLSNAAVHRVDKPSQPIPQTKESTNKSIKAEYKNKKKQQVSQPEGISKLEPVPKPEESISSPSEAHKKDTHIDQVASTDAKKPIARDSHTEESRTIKNSVGGEVKPVETEKKEPVAAVNVESKEPVNLNIDMEGEPKCIIDKKASESLPFTKETESKNNHASENVKVCETEYNGVRVDSSIEIRNEAGKVAENIQTITEKVESLSLASHEQASAMVAEAPSCPLSDNDDDDKLSSSQSNKGDDTIRTADELSESNEKSIDESAINVNRIPEKDVSSLNNQTKPFVASRKKKMKECLSKADAASATGDLYNAYKVLDDKKEEEKLPELYQDVVDTNLEDKTSSAKPESQSPKEIEDWEDAAEIPTAVTTVATEHKTSGAKKYSRDFLLTLKDQFRDLPEDFEVPDNIEILLHANDGPSQQKPLDKQPSGRLDRRPTALAGDEDRWIRNFDSRNDGPARDFRTAPQYRNMRGNAPGLLPGMSSYQQGFPGPAPMRSNSDADKWQRIPQKGIISAPHFPAIHRTERRYEVGQVGDEEQKKQRQIKSILNKLTPQNFDKLFVKVQEINIDSPSCLRGVISQIFDKALMEPTFCEMYAKFCVRLSQGLPEFYADNEKVAFKRVLLNKCQEEFEKDEQEQEAADKDADGENKLSTEEKAEKKAAARRRMLGNIRFIGELYKENMLTERIMHECIRKLLGDGNNSDQENIEALCKLMSTIGKMIDHRKAKQHIDAYFEIMSRMSSSQALPSRLRFMLRDVIDLRRNGWQQRRKIEGPKKIDEVHRDAAQELHGGRPSRGGSIGRRVMTPPEHGMRGSGGPSYMPGMPQMGSQSMGRQQVSMGNRNFGYQDARFTERNPYENRPFPSTIPSRPIDDGPITLGPQGGLGRGMAGKAQMLSSRSMISDAPPAVINSRPRIVVGPNSTAGLERVPSNLRDGNGVRSQISERASPYSSQDRNTAETDYREFRNSHPFDRSGKSTPAETFPEQSSQRVSSPQLSKEKLEQKSNMAIKEFYSVGDLKEVVMCIDELKTPTYYPTMVSSWIIDSFDRKDKEREQLGRLLSHLVKMTPITLKRQQLIEGLGVVLSCLEDTTYDAPKAPEFLGKMLGKLVVDDVLYIQDIANIIEDSSRDEPGLISSGNAADVLATVLQSVKNDKGDDIMSDLYRKSGSRLESLLLPDSKQDLKKLLEKRDIQCLYPATRHPNEKI